MHCLDLVPAHFKFDHFIRAYLPLLDQAVTRNHNEELSLRIVPMLTLRDTRLADVHAELTVVGGLQEFSEAAAIIAIHLQIEGYLLLGKITEIHGIKLLLKGAVGNRRHNQVLRLIVEGVKKLNDSTESCFMSDRSIVSRRSKYDKAARYSAQISPVLAK